MNSLKTCVSAVSIATLLVTPAFGQNQDYSHSIVTIYAINGPGGTKEMGSGFATANGIVTAYHVVQGATSIQVSNFDNEQATNVSVLAYSPTTDLALLSAQFNNAPPPLQTETAALTSSQNVLYVGSECGEISEVPESVASSTLTPVSNLTDEQLNHIFRSSPTSLQVIRFNGIIYDGMSGGPLLSANGSVIGLVSGSLSEGGTYGWAIPATQISQLLNGPTAATDPGKISWPPVPFDGNYMRSMQYFVRRDAAKESEVNMFFQQSNRLANTNTQLTNDTSTVLDELNQLSVILQSVESAPTVPGAPPESIGDMNNYLNTFGHFEFSSLHADLPALIENLSTRYKIDGELRSTVGYLPEIESRRGLNPEIQQFIQKNVNNVTNNFSDVSTNTYETENGIDTNQLLSALNSLKDDSALQTQTIQFASPSDIAHFLSEVQASQHYIQAYTFLPSFGTWSGQEQDYYSQIGKILVTVQPLVVYVPVQ